MRINAHAQDDGFPPQEDPSKTASGACRTTAAEKGSEADAEECEGLRPPCLATTFDNATQVNSIEIELRDMKRQTLVTRVADVYGMALLSHFPADGVCEDDLHGRDQD